MTKKTEGVEQFEHLKDKSALLLFMLEDEAKEIADLRASVKALKRERDTVKRINSELADRADRLKEKRSEIDIKAGVLLKALDEAYFS
jgi:uncharacterized coiled-coil DUF342 family protein